MARGKVVVVLCDLCSNMNYAVSDFVRATVIAP